MTDKPVFAAIGAALWDIIASASARMADGTDIAGVIRRRPGGVALNIARELAAQGAHVELLSAVGRDPEGVELLDVLSDISTRHVYREAGPTDSYLAIENPDGSVFGAIADCRSLEAAATKILAPLDTLTPKAIVLDGNLPEATLAHIADTPPQHAALALVPASPGKALRLKPIYTRLKCTLYVNLTEANSIADRDFANARDAAQALHEQGAASAVVTDGANRAAQACESGVFTVQPPKVAAISTTGAGDVFLATHLMAETQGASPNSALEKAAQAAALFVTKEMRK